MAFVVTIETFFAAAYAHMVTVRAALGQPALVPSGISSGFQIGGESAPMAQIAPRIVIVPTGEDYDYSQPMPITQTPTDINRLQRRTNYRVWLNFDAQIWGDPDSTPRPNPDPTPDTPPQVPAPVFGFNSTIELRRQFLNAISSLIGSASNAWQPLRAEYVEANRANNRYGRLLVLGFRVASTNSNEIYTIRDYSLIPGDGGVTGAITVQAEKLGSDTPETVATFTAPPPDPDA